MEAQRHLANTEVQGLISEFVRRSQSRGDRPASAWVAVGLLVLLGIAALPSGWQLMHPEPDGSALGMSVTLLAASPFSSYLIPGLILFGLFGLGSLAAAVAGLLLHWTGPFAAFAIGCGQMIWIVVEYVMTQAFSFLQPALFVWGMAIAVLGLLWWLDIWRRR